MPAGFAVDDDAYWTAHARLEAAIREFNETINPDEYLNHWYLITHKLSAELEQDGMSALGVHGDRGMNFVERRGMVEEALDNLRGNTR